MSVLAIPTSEDPFYDQAVDLEGKEYLLEFRFNQREACWYLSMYVASDVPLDDQDPLTARGEALFEGRKVVCKRDMLKRPASTNKPPGALMALPNTTDDSPPGLRELGAGKRVTLLYFTSDELED